MAITYTWKLTSFKKVTKLGLEDVVFQTYWEKVGTDEFGNTGKFVGATPFDPRQVDPDNFTPYESLTEEIVLGWIKNVVVGDYANHVDKQIAKAIAAVADPVTEHSDYQNTFPWSTGTVYVPPAPDGNLTPEEIVAARNSAPT
jgi:hypothetical protein